MIRARFRFASWGIATPLLRHRVREESSDARCGRSVWCNTLALALGLNLLALWERPANAAGATAQTFAPVEGHVVRVGYVVPSNRVPQPHGVANLQHNMVL